MTFKELKKLTSGKELPLMGKNENGEAVIIQAIGCKGEEGFKTTTAQHNGWVRENYFWKNGTVEELFSR